MITHPLIIGHHEIAVDREGIWCCSTLLDALIRVNHDGEVTDACFLAEQEELIRDGYRRAICDRNVNYLELAEQDDDGCQKFGEQFHLNTIVVQPSGEVDGFTCANGYVLRMRPSFEVLARMPHLSGAHNVQIVNGRLLVNHSKQRAFQIYDLSDLTSPRVHIVLDDGAGPSEQFATSGWIRGLAFITPDLIVVGTSPAGLMSINLEKCEVEERLELERDVTHAVHGLCSSEW